MHQIFCSEKASSSGSLIAVRGVTSQRWKRLRPLKVLVIEQRRGQERQAHCSAASTDLAAELQQCDSSGDWVKAVELFAEVSR